MICYRVVCSVDAARADEWRAWMMRHHIPAVLSGGLFLSAEFFQDTINDDAQRVIFCSEYRCRSLEEYETYKQHHAPRMQQEVKELFGDSFRCERSLLERVGEILP